MRLTPACSEVDDVKSVKVKGNYVELGLVSSAVIKLVTGSI